MKFGDITFFVAPASIYSLFFITLQKFSPTKVSRYNIMVCVVDNTVAVYIFTVSLTNVCGVYSINNALKDTIPEITFEWK